jgi:WD40 repeat protein
VATACEYVRQAALGLQHACERGMVHRDVKPDNLMLTADGTVKVLDFGLAALLVERGAGWLTDTNVIMGTPDYMAPEQAEDPRKADSRADVYSLGCTLYQLLTGEVPYPAQTSLLKIIAHREKPIPQVRRKRSEVPEELAGVLARLLAKKPEDRYQSPGAVAEALAPFTRPPQPPRQRRRLVVALALATLFGGMAVAGVVVYRIKTDRGDLVITTESDDVEVIIKRGGKVVKIIDTKTNKSVTVDSGTYDLELKGAARGLKLSIDKATLARGETVLAMIERVEKGPDVGGKPPAEKVGEVRRIRWWGHTYFTGFSPDSRYYLATGQVESPHTVRVWEVATGRQVLEVEGNECAAFTPNGKLLLAAGPDKSLHLWETATGQEVRRFPGHTTWVASLVISPDGKLALSGAGDGTARLWDLETGVELLKAETKQVRVRVRFAPDGKRFLTFSDVPGGVFRLWDVATRREIHSWVPPGVGVFDVGCAFLPDGKQVVAVGNDRTVHWWDVGTGKEVRSLKLRADTIYGAATSPDRRRLLYTSHAADAVHLVELPDGRETARFEVPFASYGGMSFSPDGRYAAGASANGWVYLWRLPAPPAANGKP